MSLTITVRPNGATSGGDTKTLPAEGDNGNQEIDTKAEAEAALTYVTDDKLVAVAGTKTYTRADLIKVRDGGAAPATPPVASATTIPGTGVSHGVGIEGYGLAGIGDNGHSGGGARLTYRAGIPLSTGEHRFHFDPIIGIDVGHFSKNYMTPGGEGVKSAYTSGAGVLGADFRWTPPVLKHSLWFALGMRFLAGGFGTADSATVALPTTCTPSAFGRGECEPNAGSKTGNAGTSGLWNEKLGAARGTSGLMFGLDVPLTIGARVAKGEWGSLDLFGGALFSTRFLSPKDGNGLTSSGFGGFLGALVRFGGTDAVKSKPADVAPPLPITSTSTAPEATRTAGEALILADDAAVRAFGGLSADAKILGVQFDTLPEKTSAPYEIPASAMTAGKHEVKIRYRNPGDTADRIRIVPLMIGEAAKVSDNGASYGAVLNMPATASRLAPDMVGGISTERPIPVGNVQTTADFPDKSTYQLYVDGNPVGTPQPLPKDRNTPLSLPASTKDGPHQVQLRVMRPNQTTILYPTVAVAVGPSTVTLTNVAPQPRPPAPEYSYTTASLVVDITSSGTAPSARIRRSSGTGPSDVLKTFSLASGANSVEVIAKGGGRETYSGTLIIEQQVGDKWVKIGETRSVDIKKAGGTWTPPKGKTPPKL